MKAFREDLLRAPVWHALHTQHRHLAITMEDACRYPADVAPFAAVSKPDIQQMDRLRSLMATDESLWLVGNDYPVVHGLSMDETLPCLQLAMPESIDPPKDLGTGVESLSCIHAEEMVALTEIAFPGFFRARTCRLGRYFGFRDGSGKLVAMGGERLMLPGLHEISGICTHPDFRGRGLAQRLMWQLILEHRQAGVQSWLHVTATNQAARQLYLRMGFQMIQEIVMSKVTAT